ncbi:dimethyladenosine transferase 2, mitochondrial-like isoform X2 [Portunus trituberculatus]|nr:dimethyladenosine transferase 2, mitochondrial-like isoform X2 [Portunus trituberculatus]
MMMVIRFSRISFAPKPSYLYSACQKYLNKFSLKGNIGITEDRNFSKCSACLGKASSVTERKFFLNGEDSDSASLQPTLPEDNTKISQDKNIHDLSKKIKMLLKGSKGTRRQHIVDKNVAETLVTHLKKDLGDSDIIVESSPGIGVLSETILTQTDNSVVVYEPNNKLRSYLKKVLLPQYSSRLQIQKYDFEKFYGYYIIDQKEPEKPILQNFLDPILRKEESEFLPVKIVGVIYDAKFIARLIFSYTFQCSLFGEISPVLYIYIPFSIYCKITRDLNHVYNSHGLLFQYYFNVETLHVTPKESFYPICTKSRKKLKDDEDVYLVKISAKKEFLQEVPNNERESFHFFMNTVSRIKRVDSLIIGMERWIPDCGPELIKNGFHVFAHPRELSTEQLLQAYKIFTKFPSYRESTFHYQRQQFVARYGSKDEEMLESKSADETTDLDDHDFLEN